MRNLEKIHFCIWPFSKNQIFAIWKSTFFVWKFSKTIEYLKFEKVHFLFENFQKKSNIWNLKKSTFLHFEHFQKNQIFEIFKSTLFYLTIFQKFPIFEIWNLEKVYFLFWKFPKNINSLFFSKFSKYCFSQIVLNLDPRFARSDYRFRNSNEMGQSVEHSTNGASAERDGGAVGRGRLVPQWIDGFWRDWRRGPMHVLPWADAQLD